MTKALASSVLSSVFIAIPISISYKRVDRRDGSLDISYDPIDHLHTMASIWIRFYASFSNISQSHASFSSVFRVFLEFPTVEPWF